MTWCGSSLKKDGMPGCASLPAPHACTAGMQGTGAGRSMGSRGVARTLALTVALATLLINQHAHAADAAKPAAQAAQQAHSRVSAEAAGPRKELHHSGIRKHRPTPTAQHIR